MRLLVLLVLFNFLSADLVAGAKVQRPFVYQDGKSLAGLAYEMVNAIQRRTGEKDFKIEKTKQGLNDYIGGHKKKMYFPVKREPGLEPQYKWAGPVVYSRWIIVSQNKNKKLKSNDEARKLSFILAEPDVVNNKEFDRLGYKNIIVKKDALNLFLKDTKQYYLTEELSFVRSLRDKEISKDRFMIVWEVCKEQYYIAFSKQISDEIVNLWQEIIDDLLATGVYESLWRKYTLN